jgi:hypothetical protein
MQSNGLNQTKFANAAGVSQSTVSRALDRPSKHHGAARRKLFTYANINEWIGGEPARGGQEGVLQAFERIWDGSEEHATAVAKVIEALIDLRPKKKEKRG